MFQNYGIFIKMIFSLCFFFLLLRFFLFLVIHYEASTWIGPNEPRSRGRTNRSRIGISTIQRIWVRAVRNSSPSFLPHVSDPFPPSDAPRSIDPRLMVARSFSLRYFSLFVFPLRGNVPSYRNRQFIMSYCIQRRAE